MTREMKIQDGHKWYGEWILAPLDDITTPKHGRICYGPRWWAVTDAGEVLFYQSYEYPQCNSDREILSHIQLHGAPQTTLRFVPFAFLPYR